MRRLGRQGIFLSVLALALAGCYPGLESIPAGAQEVHVVLTDSEVRLVPDTVRAGDVYVVLDSPWSARSFSSNGSAPPRRPMVP